MIVVQLAGGLGNQLFQYAAGRALAQRKRTSLRLDIGLFECDVKRTYRLNHFNISASIASQRDLDRVRGWGWRGLPHRIVQRLCRNTPYYRQSPFIEQGQQFDLNLFKARKCVYLVGYWQSEKYFKDIQDIIRAEFTVRNPPDMMNRALLEQIDQSESVSLHIRRGDYVSDPHIRQIYGLCPLEYYHSAVEFIQLRLRQPHFFIFSDEIDWAKASLNIECPCIYISHNRVGRDYEDLRLMSECKHHIIANSSFSWWGAWLCANPQKIVISPKKWFNTPDRDTEDLVPDSWYRR